jgi:hypothetical protein
LDAPSDQAFEDESEANLLAAMPVTLKKLTEAGFGTKDFVSSKRCDFVSSKRCVLDPIVNSVHSSLKVQPLRATAAYTSARDLDADAVAL